MGQKLSSGANNASKTRRKSSFGKTMHPELYMNWVPAQIPEDKPLPVYLSIKVIGNFYT
jgi:hypothetical protein